MTNDNINFPTFQGTVTATSFHFLRAAKDSCSHTDQSAQKCADSK